ncbi:response regulator [Paraburkholderia nemoris]|uniref:response regulator n=1 Tax=Paraburkholderia nemoris TaxID=2793076 RepID=UPI001F1764D4|nr:response regulator [Paraburkholderia nemoris]
MTDLETDIAGIGSLNSGFMEMDSILLVDDELEVLSAWRLILESAGFHVICAHNGARALQLLETHLPTLVITDWHMPAMSGGELCRQIKSSRRLNGVPLVIHSSIEEPGADEALWSAFLRKPCQVDVVVETVRRLCAERQQSLRARLRIAS